CHADLLPRMHVNAAVTFTRDAAPDVVADPKCSVPLSPALAQGGQRIGGLTALADGEHQRVLLHRRIPVAELARKLDLNRNLRQGFDQMLPDHRRMTRGSASDQDDAINLPQLA